MLYFIASFNGDHVDKNAHSGGASKITFLVSLLRKIYKDVLIINTSINESHHKAAELDLRPANSMKDVSVSKFMHINDGYVDYLYALIWYRSRVDEIIEKSKRPRIVWVYNSDALALSIAHYLKKNYRAKIVLEFEDWIFSRRGYRAKNLLDALYWARYAKYIDSAFAVNYYLIKKAEEVGIKTLLLPGVCPDWTSEAAHLIPFKDEKIVVGYFGGLTEEKGANKLLDIIEEYSEGSVVFVVTGWGLYHTKFVEMGKKKPEVLKYYGKVDGKNLIDLIKSVDIVLNPHVPMKGVFPFKMIEAVASGKLLISTRFTCLHIPYLHDSICWVDCDSGQFVNAINASRSIYNSKKKYIRMASMHLMESYGMNGVMKLIESQVGKI